MRVLALFTVLAWSLHVGPAVSEAVQQLDFEVIGQLAHSRSDFTQGLEIRDGVLYQGTGIVGRSRLQAFDLASGELLRERVLPRPFFGEGITVFGDLVIQLTWQSRRVFVYRREDFTPLGAFAISTEGWGLTNDGARLIYSDGSDVLRVLPTEGEIKVEREIHVRRGDTPVQRLNELEWTPQGIWANVWERDLLVRIDPASGQVNAELNLKGLLPRSEYRPGTNVLNGIAYDAADGTLWVTGKNWPWLYQLKLITQ